MGRNAAGQDSARRKAFGKGRANRSASQGKGLSSEKFPFPNASVPFQKEWALEICGFGFFLSGIGEQGVACFVRRFIRVGAQANRYHDQRVQSHGDKSLIQAPEGHVRFREDDDGDHARQQAGEYARVAPRQKNVASAIGKHWVAQKYAMLMTPSIRLGSITANTTLIRRDAPVAIFVTRTACF